MLVLLKLHSGFVVSFAFAVKVVTCVIVTVVLALVVLAGLFPLVTVQPEKLYHALVFAVALIFALAPYLYVHAPFTLLIHVHLFNVNAYVLLSYQHAYV